MRGAVDNGDAKLGMDFHEGLLVIGCKLGRCEINLRIEHKREQRGTLTFEADSGTKAATTAKLLSGFSPNGYYRRGAKGYATNYRIERGSAGSCSHFGLADLLTNSTRGSVLKLHLRDRGSSPTVMEGSWARVEALHDCRATAPLHVMRAIKVVY
jgi:hypothetical protein